MAGDTVSIVQKCGACGSELGSLEVKKENMMLFSKETIWCPQCQADRPEVRDVAERLAAIAKESESLPPPPRT